MRRAPGRPPRLSARRRQQLLQQLLRGPMAHGYPTDLWTTQRIAEVIERRYGVRYHRNHVSRLLAQCGWSCQKPERRARERDEQEVWTLTKKQLANGSPDDRYALALNLIEALETCRRSQRQLRGCITYTRLPLFRA